MNKYIVYNYVDNNSNYCLAKNYHIVGDFLICKTLDVYYYYQPNFIFSVHDSLINIIKTFDNPNDAIKYIEGILIFE